MRNFDIETQGCKKTKDGRHEISQTYFTSPA